MSEITLFDLQLQLVADFLVREEGHRVFAEVFKRERSKGRSLFSRDCLPYHLTASAWITNASLTRCLLIFHRKLRVWIQPGGHPDGGHDLRGAALREAQEETGLSRISFRTNEIFDVDVTPVPGHSHLDVRYWLVADDEEFSVPSDEVMKCQWFSLQMVQNGCSDLGVRRMAELSLGGVVG